MPSRQHDEFNRHSFPLFTKGFRLASQTTGAAANTTLVAESPPLQYIDPNGGARNVTLPVIDDASKGLMFVIFNTSDATSGEALTLKTSAGSSLAPSVVVEINEGVMVVNDGTTWRGLVSANT